MKIRRWVHRRHEDQCDG